MIKIVRKTIIILITIAISAISTSANDELMKAMRDELTRSMNQLELEGLQKPYFIEYKVQISKAYEIKSLLGATLASNENEYATLSVNVRVGDYKFDNSNYFDVGLSFFGSDDDEERFTNRRIPLNPDYEALRRELWLATDAAYKQAAELYSKKEAIIKNKIRKDTTHDFLRMTPIKTYDKTTIPNFDVKKYKSMCNRISAVLKNYPEINKTSVGMEFIPIKTYYANSEGTEYIRTDLFTGFEVVGITQADDGMPLMNFYSAYGLTPDDLPTEDSLLSATKDVANKLTSLKKAPLLEETYSGPVIFENQAGAELFTKVFAPNLVAQRKKVSESGFRTNEDFRAFQRKIGGRVLPEFMSIIAKPQQKSYINTTLAGYFTVDDDGNKAEETLLVKDGYLKSLLSSRVPTKRVRESNGHNRGGAAMYSNLFIESDDKHSKSSKELRDRMMELCKARELPYGIIVKKVMNTNILYTTLIRISQGNFDFPNRSNISLIEVYKLYPDGSEELVRGGEAAGISVQSFKDIIETGKDKYAYNLLARSVAPSFLTGGSAWIAASIVTPSLLFEDAEIRIIESDFNKPPIIDYPQ